MAENNTVRVSHVDDHWQVKSDGAERAAHRADTKEEAVRLGRALAESKGAELVIVGLDGKIQDKDSHGNDPRSIPG